jgi:geranylgeranyl pyrophosphate synthase
VHKENLSSSRDVKLDKEFLRFFKERGKGPSEMARQSVLNEISKIESVKVREALRYFIVDYWQDLARPTLLSVCCEAVGGIPKVTVPFAVSLSILSGGIDVHDDIIDESKRKHGRITVYGRYGKEIALLTADALFFKGFTLLYEASAKIEAEKMQKIMEIIKCLFYELGDAEALELELRGRWNVAEEEYLRIIKKKAADVEAHARIGALFGNATASEEERLARYGRLLGMIIIIRDDIADLLDPREVRHRLKKEHIPLPLIYALKEKRKEDLSKIPPNKILKDFRKNIEGGIRQSNNLLKELSSKASFQTKNFEIHEKLDYLIRALSASTINFGRKKILRFSPTTRDHE